MDLHYIPIYYFAFKGHFKLTLRRNFSEQNQPQYFAYSAVQENKNVSDCKTEKTVVPNQVHIKDRI